MSVTGSSRIEGLDELPGLGFEDVVTQHIFVGHGKDSSDSSGYQGQSVERFEPLFGLGNDELALLLGYTWQVGVSLGEHTGNTTDRGAIDWQVGLGINLGEDEFLRASDVDRDAELINGNAGDETGAVSVSTSEDQGYIRGWEMEVLDMVVDTTNGLGSGTGQDFRDGQFFYQEVPMRGPVVDATDDVTIRNELNVTSMGESVLGFLGVSMFWLPGTLENARPRFGL